MKIGEKLNKDLNATSSTYDRELGCQGNGFTLSSIQVEELRKEITNIKVFKSSGIDNVASKIMRDAFTILEEQFRYILNKSIELNKFPDEWKKATVISLPKINNAKLVSDFRPISLLPLAGKIIEKLLHNQLLGISKITLCLIPNKMDLGNFIIHQTQFLNYVMNCLMA